MVKCTPRVFFIFFEGDFLGSSTETNTQQFQALKGIGTPVEKIIQSVDLFFSSTINSFAYCISTR